MNSAAFYKLLKSRRSRRFGLGMEIPDGPLKYKSNHSPKPLTKSEEGALAFAAAGITGGAVRDLDFSERGGGNILAGKWGRTIPSGDAIQSVSLFVINDDGAFLMPRASEVSSGDLDEMIRLGQQEKWQEWYEKFRVQICDHRPAPPKHPIFNLNLNSWSANVPGSTVFLPVNDLGILYINGLLEIFNENNGVFVLDERANFSPAGVGQFAKSKGGHLDDDAAQGKIVTVRHVETMVTEFVAIEQGMMLQNLALMSEALGLGGYPHFANHEFAWFEALGFQMEKFTSGDYLGANRLIKFGMKLLHKDIEVPVPVGLERNGKPLLRAMCPPYFHSMKEAVEHVVSLKQKGFSEGDSPSSFKDESGVNKGVAPVSRRAIDTTVAYCDYLWKTYKRFPAFLTPFRATVAFQAVHLDAEFYEKFYKEGVLTERHRKVFESDVN